MERHTNGIVDWFTFDLFNDSPRLAHAVFLRHGGVSSKEFSSLNCGKLGEDLAENIAENKQRAFSAINVKECCGLWQEHGKKIILARPREKERGDGLTTDHPNLALSILHADCQAALFYDPIHQALSAIHCGWRGNVHNIYKETVKVMGKLYNSKPQDLLVGISPSLGPNASEFIHYLTELPDIFYPFQIKPNYFDLWAISRWQLSECGILPHHIEIASMCTFSNPQDFFSYRRAKNCGQHMTVAYLKN